MTSIVLVAVRCPYCDKRLPVDVPQGTFVSAKCSKCKGEFSRKV